MTEQGQTRVPAGATRVGRYALLESLGIGGMGEVHRARAYAAAGVVKDVCIKRIRAERLVKQGATDRFIAEARLSMRLTHGNIVPVFDFGRAGGEYYLAMEWVDGADLRAILNDAREHAEPFSPEVAAHVVAEVARALAYAHALVDVQGRAVVHRDVKPANVLVSRAGDVKLTDFGVATFADEAATGVGGTPAYMAPEQRVGGPVDARTDVWALGVLLVELAAGLRVGETPGLVELATERMPDKLRDVARRAIREPADERYPSARELAGALEQIVSEARAGGAPAPREDLAARASRAATARRTRAESDELGADASFLRDGDDESFEALMTLTGQTQSTRPPPPAVTVPQVPDRALEPRAARETPAAVEAAVRPERSRARLLLVSAAVVSALVLAVALASRGPTGERPPATPVHPPASATANDVPSEEPATDPPSQADVPSPLPSPLPSPPPTASSDPVPAPIAPAVPPRRSPSTPPRAQPPRPTAPVRRATSGAGVVSVAGAPTVASEPALVSINAIPWAEVTIDGRPAGTTPLFSVHVAPGTHTVRFTNVPLGATRESELTVSAGERRSFVVDLR